LIYYQHLPKKKKASDFAIRLGQVGGRRIIYSIDANTRERNYNGSISVES